MIRVGIFLLGVFSLGFGQATRTVMFWQDQGTPAGELTTLVQHELSAITTGRMALDYRVETWPNRPQQGSYDVLITLGPRTGQFMAGQEDYPVPIIIGTVLDPEIQRLPAQASGGSGKQNLNYITSPFDTQKDLALFRKIIDYQHLAILLDAELNRMVTPRDQVVDSLIQGREKITLVPLSGESPQEVRSLLPEDCDAIYLLPLGQKYEQEQLTALLDTLSEAGLPTFAMLGSAVVEAGAMASRAPAQSNLSVARRIALNALAILEGEPAEEQPVQTTSQGEDFVINFKAVGRSQVFPSWQALGEARLINLELQPEGTPIHLRGVIMEALEENLAYKISQQETEAGEQEIRLALAEMLPDLSVSSNFSVIDQARSAASFGSTQPYTWAASAELNQVLFAEPLYANLRIQKLLQASRVASQDQTELDAVLNAAEAYFNVLLAASVVQLQNKNVDNTRINLNLANDKEAVGYAGVSEVYRWESQLAL
ncbi:MAG: TolC family protein, partial [Bacteroidota bacterium]